jgi:hypothetical protein
MADSPQDTETKLQQLVEKSHHVLFTAKAMFPFQLIPDRIVIDQNKVTVEYRNILQTENIQTILLQDMADVQVTYILFLANLTLVRQGEYVSIPFLRREDAVRAKQIIAGLLIARKEELVLDDVEPGLLVDKLIEIGKLHVA